MFEIHKYTFPGTNLHYITFAIIAVELVIFFYQLMYFLIRPKDMNRLWFLILLLMLLQYNIIGGLFVDPRLSTPLFTQYIFAFGSGILMCMYFPFYVFKFLNVKELKFFAYYGSIYFLFIPFITFFIIPYYITGNIELSRKLVVIVPFLYSIAFLYAVIRSLLKFKKNSSSEDYNFREKAIGVCFALFFWVGGLSVVTFINGNQVVEHVTTNIGFLIMTVIFIRSMIRDSKTEYRRLLKSEADLQNINSLLSQKIEERTKEIENLYSKRYNSFIRLAHEIKTPVTLISNYMDDLVKTNKTEELQIIHENVGKLKADIINFFDIEKFNRGELPDYKHNSIINLSNLLYNKTCLFNIYAQKKKIYLNSKIEENIYLKADINAIHSIFNNLIENAVKNTPSDGIVSVSMESKEEKIVFTVSDSGCGIPEELKEKIFLPFFHISNGKDEDNGYGVGLAIVDNAVKSLEGSISINTSAKTGSVFHVELPRYFLNSGDNINDISFEKKSPYTNKEINDFIDIKNLETVMVIEDNHDLLKYLKEKLEKTYNVIVADNGKTALDKLKAHIPALIISDVMMDEMNGFEFLKTIKTDQNLKHIPVIFLTAKSTAIDRIEGLSLGAVDYMQKPFLIDELITKVDSILKTVKAQHNAVLNSAFDYINSKLGRSDDALETEARNLEKSCAMFKISHREKEIILLIKKGYSYKDISTELNISDKTVIKHSQNIFKKTSVNSKNELISKVFSSPVL